LQTVRSRQQRRRPLHVAWRWQMRGAATCHSRPAQQQPVAGWLRSLFLQRANRRTSGAATRARAWGQGVDTSGTGRLRASRLGGTARARPSWAPSQRTASCHRCHHLRYRQCHQQRRPTRACCGQPCRNFNRWWAPAESLPSRFRSACAAAGPHRLCWWQPSSATRRLSSPITPQPCHRARQ
jgi:hypothetical protein